ncbi:MAG: hypothetical protein MJ123_03340 [Lachnospiraceae bacterium]|nr:hypothetical protein [Lachnospiraceae bacterium]
MSMMSKSKAVLSEKFLFRRITEDENILSRLKIISYIRGWLLFRKYKKLYKNAFVLSSHIGEVVFTCSYVEAYKKQWGIDKCCVITFDRFIPIVGLYETFDDVFALDPKPLRALSYYLSDKNHLKTGFVNDIWKNKHSQDLFNKCKHSKIGYHAEFYSTYLKIDIRSQIKKPDISLIGNYLSNRNSNLDFTGKTILICPLAQTVKMIPNTFWEKLVSRIISKGYKVYINGNMDIENAITIKPDLIELVDLASKVNRVISLQSGLSDLLVELGIECDVIMYEEQAFYRRKDDYPFVVPSLTGINDSTDFDYLVERLIERL